MKILKSKNGTRFIWMKWGKKYRWISLEASSPVWWKPHFDRYSFGFRTGWLLFAFGTGVVSKEVMDNMVNIIVNSSDRI